MSKKKSAIYTVSWMIRDGGYFFPRNWSVIALDARETYQYYRDWG